MAIRVGTLFDTNSVLVECVCYEPSCSQNQILFEVFKVSLRMADVAAKMQSGDDQAV